MKCRNKYSWLPALSLLCCLPSLAATVYKSIDENGVVSYSDTRPPEDILVETVVIQESPAPEGGQEQQRLQDMRETTDRMITDRMAREKHRAELRQLAANKNTQPASQEPLQYYNNVPIYTGYQDYPLRQPWRRPHYPRPQHPIVYPPLRPHVEIRPPEFLPFSVNDYPASLIRKSYDPKVREAFQ